MSVRRKPTSFVTTTAAALVNLAGREVKTRVVLAAGGGAVEMTRHRGGCWKISGPPMAVEGVKAKLRKANAKVLHPRPVCKVERRPFLFPEVVHSEEYHGRPVVVTRHYAPRGDRFVAYAESWGTFCASTTTGTDQNEVLERLKTRLPVVVKESTFRGRAFEILRVHRKGKAVYIAEEGGGIRRQGDTARDAEKALVSALGGGRSKRATFHKAQNTGTYEGRSWQDSDNFDSPFAGLDR